LKRGRRRPASLTTSCEKEGKKKKKGGVRTSAVGTPETSLSITGEKKKNTSWREEKERKKRREKLERTVG